MDKPKIISRKIALWLLIGFIITGAYLRLHNLRGNSFWTDEFFHVFSAKGIIETGKPILPSGELYTRSIFFTYIVALFFKLFSINEISARMPSVIFSLATIPLTYYIVSRMLNRNTGVISAFLVAFAPFSILWAQQCRMYTLFQFLYLLSVYCFFRVFENNTQPFYSFKNIIKYASFICIFIFSLLVHEIGILFIPGCLMYIFAMCIFTCFKDGLRACLRGKYFKWALILGLVGVAVLFYKIYAQKTDMAQLITHNAIHDLDKTDLNYYRDIIQNTYPFFSYIYSAALIMLIAGNPRIGLYLGSSFLIPFMLLSFVFTVWKGYRYMFFIFPFFLIVIAYAAENILYYILRFFDFAAAALDADDKRKKSINTFFKSLAVLSLLYPLLFPWIKTAPRAFSDFGMYNFSKTASYIKELDKNDLLICTEPFLIEYYVKRKPDFIILTRWFGGSTYEPAMIDAATRKKVDRNCGIPLIENIKMLKGIENTGRKIWLISNKYFLQPITSDEDILGYVKQNYKKYQFSDNTFEVYYHE